MKTIAICIPTYNRENDLKILLNDILLYGKKYIDSGSVEVCISDNASIDNTAEVVESYKKSIGSLTYNRNFENLGFGINLRKAIDMSTSEYCWLMGSDDRPTENSFDILFEAIETSPDLIIGNVISNDREHKFLAVDGNLTFEFGGVNVFSEYLGLCEEVSAAFAFISTIIVKKEFWYVRQPTANELTHPYTHMIQICKNIASQKTILLYVNKPIVVHGFENRNEYNQTAFPHFELDLTTFKYIEKNYFFGAADIIDAYACITKKSFNLIRLHKARVEATAMQWENIYLILQEYGYGNYWRSKKKYDPVLKYFFQLSKKLRAYKIYFWE